MYQFCPKQKTTKLCPKKQNKTLHIPILASCYTIAWSFPLQHFISKWNLNAFFDFSDFGLNPGFKRVHLLSPPAVWRWILHVTKLLLGISTAFCWENDDNSSAYFCHTKTKGSIRKTSSYSSNSSPLVLMWFPV